MHPLAALITGGMAGYIFVWMFTLTQNRWKIDDVLGVWPLHGLCGAWGGLAAGIFGYKELGGLGGVSFWSQLMGTTLGIMIAVVGGFVIYGVLKKTVGIRLDPEEEYEGADLSVHRISATPEREVSW
jgi:Amt family ammonium transporter